MKYFLVFLIYVCSTGFFGIQGNPLLQYNVSGQDIIIVISFLLLLLMLFKIPINVLKDSKYIIFLFLYCLLVSPIMAFVNFEQPFFFSFSSSRLFLSYFILLMALASVFYNVKINEAIINFIFILIATFLFLINFYIYFSENYDLIENLKVLERFDEVRFMIGGGTVIYLTIYFFKNRNFAKINYVVLFLLMAILLVISKTRGIILPLTFMIIISLFKELRQTNFLKSIFAFSVALFFVSFFLDVSVFGKYFEKIISFTQSDLSSNQGEYAFRTEELLFFVNKLDIKSLIFGYGMDNTKFAKLYANENTRYFLSDLGVFSIVYYHGVFGFAIFIASLLQFYRECKVDNSIFHEFGKGFILFQLFSFTTLTFFHSIEIVAIFIFMFVSVKIINQRKGYKQALPSKIFQRN